MTMISLLLQNSSGVMSVGLASGEKLLFDSVSDIDLAGSRNVELYVKAALRNSNKTVSDLDFIFVDIGPGGLGATRTTAAFANAIGFARKIPVIGINAFELIGTTLNTWNESLWFAYAQRRDRTTTWACTKGKRLQILVLLILTK